MKLLRDVAIKRERLSYSGNENVYGFPWRPICRLSNFDGDMGECNECGYRFYLNRLLANEFRVRHASICTHYLSSNEDWR